MRDHALPSGIHVFGTGPETRRHDLRGSMARCSIINFVLADVDVSFREP